jgi:hypothetical protein
MRAPNNLGSLAVGDIQMVRQEFGDACMSNDGGVVRIGPPETLGGNPYFRTLYRNVEDYRISLDRGPCDRYDYLGDGVYADVIFPWVPQAKTITERLVHFRQLSTLGDTRQLEGCDLIQWYALSRLNDKLLTDLHALQLDHEMVVPIGQETNYSIFLAHQHSSKLEKYRKREAEYTQFYREIGISVLYDLPFHPFYHEIVSVTYDERLPSGVVVVGDVSWPCLMFGDMMIARAGAHVLCNVRTLDKSIAESSTLYWALSREKRRAIDLSEGWGHNSQWNTFFRLDYHDGDLLQFNVWHDHHWLDDTYLDSWPPDRREEKSNLTIEERIELLTHRCFVTFPDRGAGLWPWDDRYSLPRPNDAP